jgi:hypothetical protein
MTRFAKLFLCSALLLAGLVATLLLQAPTAQAAAGASTPQVARPVTIENATDISSAIPISGTSVQMLQMETQVFSRTSSTTVKGDSYPAFIICPGFPEFTAPGSFTAVKCGPNVGNGFRGWVESQERVIRDYSNPVTPTFTFSATQVFVGNVWLEGKSYFGSLTQFMELTGNLSTPPGVDCLNEPENPNCGAVSFQGTWTIVPSEGSGELEHLLGSGTLAWGGIASGLPPFYTGELYFENLSYLPVIANQD